MKKQIITLTVAALTLSSCGIYTKYKPATEVPINLYGEEVVVTDTLDNMGNLSWREVFTDPQLQILIEKGLQNNTDLQSAQWQKLHCYLQSWLICLRLHCLRKGL